LHLCQASADPFLFFKSYSFSLPHSFLEIEELRECQFSLVLPACCCRLVAATRRRARRRNFSKSSKNVPRFYDKSLPDAATAAATS